MNVEAANQIQITTVMTMIGHQPYLIIKDKHKYRSPLTSKKAQTFTVNLTNNTWYDRAISKGGNTLDLVGEYLRFNGEDNTQVDALRWLSNMKPEEDATSIVKTFKNLGCKIIRDEPLSDIALVRFLERNGIDVEFAKKCALEVTARNLDDNNIVSAIGMRNEDGGFEIINALLNSFVAPRSIIFIRGIMQNPDQIHFFNNVLDYLTFLTINSGQHKGNVIILTSSECLDKIKPYLNQAGYRSAYSWMPNDDEGEVTTDKLRLLAKKNSLIFKRLNKIYKPSVSLSKWHRRNLSLDTHRLQ